MATGLNDFLICIEMFLLAIVHAYVFPYQEYQVNNKLTLSREGVYNAVITPVMNFTCMEPRNIYNSNKWRQKKQKYICQNILIFYLYILYFNFLAVVNQTDVIKDLDQTFHPSRMKKAKMREKERDNMQEFLAQTPTLGDSDEELDEDVKAFYVL